MLTEQELNALEKPQLVALVRDLQARLAALEPAVAELKARVDMNSGNSSKPPSTDSPFKRPPPSAPTGRKPGAQPGRAGKFRRLAQTADNSESVRPCACVHCGLDLTGSAACSTTVREVVDIEVKAHVRHIELAAVRCPGCKKRTRAVAPSGTPKGAFGPNLQAAIGLLTMQGTCRGDIQKLLQALFKVDIAIGSIDNTLTTLASASADAVDQIWHHVNAQGVAHADETGRHVRGKLGWMWSAIVAGAEYFRFDPRRNREALFQLIGVFEGILHSDRWGPYALFRPEERQLCHAHLRRDLQAIIDRGGPDAEVAKRMLALSDAMFETWHRFGEKAIDGATMAAQMQPVKDGWKQGATELEQCGKSKSQALGRSLLALWPALWTFIDVEDVQPTNNAQEQALRKLVKLRKNCFGSTSDTGAKRTASLMTVFGTARKQGRSVFQWLAAAMDRYNRGLSGALLLPPPLPTG